jgi:serine/threonine protein kinase
MSEPTATGDWQLGGAAATVERPTIPGYEILEELGRGGMGVVYKAYKMGSQQPVALKMIRDGALAGPQDRTRFRIEAEAAARMRHPNIVHIHEVGEHVGRPWFAMELIEGGSLDTHVAGRPQPVKQAAELVRSLALAVQHAHEQKIVHRDLKPANVLLAGVGDQGSGGQESGARASLIPDPRPLTPKITDFGLAKRLDSDSTACTQEGAVLGTASYMAPEQAAGRVSAIGPAVDIYALGAILYELLTGRPPFQAASWNETVQQVIHEEPVLPTSLRPDAPRDLETVCLKCLEKEPGQRYASAGELAEDLARFLQGRPIAAVPVSERERLARLAARDGYQVVEEIGRGARSVVYRAVYEPLKQAVALKVFHPGICTREEWEAQLQRGAELWAVLAHAQIVPVNRAGWWNGVPYLALEYVPQGSLAARLADRSFSPPSSKGIRPAVHLVQQLADVVGYLHRQGVVHGNLKPSNVLLAADDVPRVSDFRLTSGLFQGPWHVVQGNPDHLAYLAPELIEKPDAELRPPTDIYGLGVILYQLLTKRPPFAAASASEMLGQVRFQDPIPLSRLNPEVTPELEACCLRCLRKNPWRRYARAYDLMTHLRHCLGDPRQAAVRS